jgi:putative PEP-CTERM system histidine kinase
MGIGTVSYCIGLAANLLLCVWLLVRRDGHQRLLVATAATAAWCGILSVQEARQVFSPPFISTIEILRAYVWLAFFDKLLNPGDAPAGPGRERRTPPGRRLDLHAGITIALGLQLLYIWLAPALEPIYPRLFHPPHGLLGPLIFALVGLILIEQYFRNVRTDLRWRIKFLCLAVGAMFAYDFYFYADAVLFQRVNRDLWEARGAVAALVTPLIAVSAARKPRWSLDAFVSRQVVFHSVTLLGSGIYLLLMATAGYYIKTYGGEWGTVARIVFLFGAFLLLALLLFSGQMRARVRVFLSRHFFTHTYDYRREWLRIINTLSDTRLGLSLEERIILALGQTVESPSGLLWERTPQGSLIRRAEFGNPGIDLPHIDGKDPLIGYMEDKEWLVNLAELITMPEAYQGLDPPAWLAPYPDAWLLVPLFRQENRLYGLVLLTKPRTVIHWNWEVIDLLKTSSRLAASYLALEDAGRALTEARQFEGFNRLSAFVIHDLKNLIAQLSLVVGNAERHQHNPGFMRDAIKTVDHAVGKMNRLIAQLRNPGQPETSGELELGAVVRDVLETRRGQAPCPCCEPAGLPIFVKADRDRLASALEHVVHNAQDAAGRQGRVTIRTRLENSGHAVVEVEDNGRGMDEGFLRTRLFKPFDTTKGLTGMGIGAYESREYIRSLGGELLVRSEPGRGTRFSFLIPVMPRTADRAEPEREVQAA